MTNGPREGLKHLDFSTTWVGTSCGVRDATFNEGYKVVFGVRNGKIYAYSSLFLLFFKIKHPSNFPTFLVEAFCVQQSTDGGWAKNKMSGMRFI